MNDEFKTTEHFLSALTHELGSPDIISNALKRYEIHIVSNPIYLQKDIRDSWDVVRFKSIRTKRIPLLAFRCEGNNWRIVLPINEIMDDIADDHPDYRWTVQFSVSSFSALIRESPNICL